MFKYDMTAYKYRHGRSAANVNKIYLWRNIQVNYLLSPPGIVTVIGIDDHDPPFSTTTGVFYQFLPAHSIFYYLRHLLHFPSILMIFLLPLTLLRISSVNIQRQNYIF